VEVAAARPDRFEDLKSLPCQSASQIQTSVITYNQWPPL
jgi:hypothetical protein